jgi:pyruvate decarboxylase
MNSESFSQDADLPPSLPRSLPPSNKSYAADGCARKNGVSAMVVTYTVGGLSAVNAVAGAYSDDLPLIFISGAPNSNDHVSDRILHHTIGRWVLWW